MTTCQNTCRLLALVGVGVFGLLTLVGSGGGGGDGGGSPAAPKAWGTAQLIEANDLFGGVRPQIAVDGSGTAIAVWYQQNGPQFSIWANRFSAGAWGTAELIETVDTGGAADPQIAMDGSGDAVAVWYQFDGIGMRQNIWANRFSAGAWGTAVMIETEDLGDALSPQISVDGSGNAIAVWEQFDGMDVNIWANRFDAGTGWGTAELIELNPGNADTPQIAVDGSGNFIAVWSQANDIWANRFDAGLGAWGTAVMIETDAGGAAEPQIAMDGSGDAIAIWYQFDGMRQNIWANRFSAGAWGTAVMIETEDLGDAFAPQISADGSGNAFAVWYQSDGTRDNIWANRFSAGAWGTAQLIETDNAGNAQFPQIAVDGSGNTIAVWQQNDGARANIWANRFSAGAWGTAQLIESDDAGTAQFPQIAVAASGNAIAVWQQNDGMLENVWANRFE